MAGRREKIASPPPTLDVGLAAPRTACAPAAPARRRRPLAGARSAARCATALGAAGCLALSFPLHPPGRPEKSRLEELTGAGVPTLVVQGERDPMGRPEEFPEDIDLAVVPAADHGLGVPSAAARPRPRRWPSWWRRPWNGWSARSPGIPDRIRALRPVVLALMDRSRPPVPGTR